MSFVWLGNFGQLFVMQNKTIDLVELLSACVDLSERAGDIVREIAKSGELHTKEKDGGEDAVTQADLKAQEFIEGCLKTHWGEELKIIGEENLTIKANNLFPNTNRLKDISIPSNFQRTVPISDVTVYVDPLDATREFTLGNTFCVVTLIGIAVKDQAVAGVMHQPFEGNTGRTIWGLVGVGTFGIPNITQTTLNRKDNKYILVTTRLHHTPDVQLQLEKVSSLVSEVIKVGGAGYKVIMLLEGKADIYLYPRAGTKKWDTCAPEAILKCVGGRITDIFGNPIDYRSSEPVGNDKGILATRAGVEHQKIVELLNQTQKN